MAGSSPDRPRGATSAREPFAPGAARLELLRGVFESDARRGMREVLVALVYAVRAIGARTLVASTIHDAGELERLGDASAPVGVPLVA